MIIDGVSPYDPWLIGFQLSKVLISNGDDEGTPSMDGFFEGKSYKKMDDD